MRWYWVFLHQGWLMVCQAGHEGRLAKGRDRDDWLDSTVCEPVRAHNKGEALAKARAALAAEAARHPVWDAETGDDVNDDVIIDDFEF